MAETLLILLGARIIRTYLFSKFLARNTRNSCGGAKIEIITRRENTHE